MPWTHLKEPVCLLRGIALAAFAMSTSTPLALLERVGILPTILSGLAAATGTVALVPFRGLKASSLGREFQNALNRSLTARLSVRQVQYLAGTTTSNFLKWIRAHPGEEHSTLDLGQGAKLHWLGSPKAEVVILYIHGEFCYYHYITST
jgi:hypothetical protein